jgi:hypothetical protein
MCFEEMTPISFLVGAIVVPRANAAAGCIPLCNLAKARVVA